MANAVPTRIPRLILMLGRNAALTAVNPTIMALSKANLRVIDLGIKVRFSGNLALGAIYGASFAF